MKRRTSRRRVTSRRRRTSRRPMRRNTSAPKLYVWEWVGGGYNSALATSKEDALSIAKKMGAPRSYTTKGGGRITIAALVPDPATVRPAKPGDLNRLEATYGWGAG